MEGFGEGYGDGKEEVEEEEEVVAEGGGSGEGGEGEEVGEEFGWDEDGSRKSCPRPPLKCSVIYSVGSENFLQQCSPSSTFV